MNGRVVRRVSLLRPYGESITNGDISQPIERRCSLGGAHGGVGSIPFVLIVLNFLDHQSAVSIKRDRHPGSEHSRQTHRLAPIIV